MWIMHEEAFITGNLRTKIKNDKNNKEILSQNLVTKEKL